jgi:hypothetical protein
MTCARAILFCTVSKPEYWASNQVQDDKRLTGNWTAPRAVDGCRNQFPDIP